MSRRTKKKKYRTYSSQHGARRRVTLVTHPDSIHCGDNHYTVNGGRSWIAAKPSVYIPSTYGRPYSMGNGLSDETHPGPPYRTGGPFNKFTFSDPCTLTHTGVYYGWLSANIGYRYSGGFLPVMRYSDFHTSLSPVNLADETNDGDSSISSFGDVDAYGATGWNKFRPGNPTADLGVFLGELRDTPRMLKGTAEFFRNLWKECHSKRSFNSRNVANSWLNTQFGWLPFISDLRKFYETYENLNQNLDQIRRNNGKWIRRRGTVLVDESSDPISESNTVTGHWPVLASYFYQQATVSGSRKLRLKKSRNIWFEGAFRYWIPTIESVIWKPRAIAELYGAMPNPSLIWNLIPWSWLVDWCSNVGDVISNMSTGYADNLAAKYAYIMGHTEWTGELDSTHALKGAYIHDTWNFPVEWKTRSAASPFGFGLTKSDFSLRQLSILSALGISRLQLK